MSRQFEYDPVSTMSQKVDNAGSLRYLFWDATVTQCVTVSRPTAAVPRPGAGSRHHFKIFSSLGTTRHPMLGQRSPIRTLGEANVAVRNGFVVSATDSAGGSRWRADENRKTPWHPRYLTHFFVLALALPPLTITVAQAHAAPIQRQRIVLESAARDRPETIKAIPADPPPPPPPPPPPAPPKPVAPPAPVPPRIVYATGPVADIIRAAAARHGVDPNTLLRVAMCESGLNPNSYNARSGASGLFQFKPATYAAHGGHNIWDPVEQADIAAKMFSQGLASAWTCK